MAPLAGVEMENDPDDNPCFGCGPRNPVGLHLRFFDGGETVRAELDLDDRYAGWPGWVISGVLYTAMDETAYWAAYARFGELATTDGKPEVAFPGAVRTGQPFTVACRVIATDGPWSVFESTVEQGGKQHAWQRSRMRRRSRSETEALRRLENFPRSLVGVTDEMLQRERPEAPATQG